MKRTQISAIMVYTVMCIILCILMYPIFLIIMTSFKTSIETQTKSPFALPEALDLSNYIRAIETSNLALYFKNSMIVLVVTIFFLVLLSSTAAFAIAKLEFRYNNKFLSFFLLGITIPIHVTLIPLFQIYKAIHILNTPLSLILPQIGFNLPLSIYLFTTFYQFIPDSMMEAAAIDGASVFQIFRNIMFPMSRNTIVTVITMNTIFVWNEFIFANTFISKSQLKTISIGLYDYIGAKGIVDWGATFSAISIFLIPLLFVYFILNKGIVAGMTAGAVKE